jgi:hypothetical protein
MVSKYSGILLHRKGAVLYTNYIEELRSYTIEHIISLLLGKEGQEP